jgi:hypothetical protein
VEPLLCPGVVLTAYPGPGQVEAEAAAPLGVQDGVHGEGGDQTIGVFVVAEPSQGYAEPQGGLELASDVALQSSELLRSGIRRGGLWVLACASQSGRLAELRLHSRMGGRKRLRCDVESQGSRAGLDANRGDSGPQRGASGLGVQACESGVADP